MFCSDLMRIFAIDFIKYGIPKPIIKIIAITIISIETSFLTF